ncbi:MAG: hypothetical protein H0X29_08075 [Parachlamydiaceae bacterium]|nr:hypothetical protein [Parachlamydiaceae bacterium]
MIPSATIKFDLSPEDKKFLRINPKQESFTTSELEAMARIVKMALPTTENRETSNWEASALYEKAAYFVDFFHVGENAQVHAKKMHNEDLLARINIALGQLK